MYIDPHTVVSPKNKVQKLEVLFDRGPVDRSWSLARLEYGGQKCLGIRWNGDNLESKKGVPLANAHPVWFILPAELSGVVEAEVERLKGNRDAELLEGYRMMAADRAQETEAEEWTEGLIGDAY
ncbi:MAG TPA: hypothetical protein VGG62_05270 [Terracidiphilus sp.]